MIFFIPYICLLGLTSNQYEPSGHPCDTPQVFLLSQSESIIDCLQMEFPSSLLNVCDNNSEKAFAFWKPFIKQIEVMAQKEGVYTPGTKLWIKAFWDQQGHLMYIGYASKHEAPLTNHSRWERVFKACLKDSRMDGPWRSGFYHLGSICWRSNS